MPRSLLALDNLGPRLACPLCLRSARHPGSVPERAGAAGRAPDAAREKLCRWLLARTLELPPSAGAGRDPTLHVDVPDPVLLGKVQPGELAVQLKRFAVADPGRLGRIVVDAQRDGLALISEVRLPFRAVRADAAELRDPRTLPAVGAVLTDGPVAEVDPVVVQAVAVLVVHHFPWGRVHQHAVHVTGRAPWLGKGGAAGHAGPFVPGLTLHASRTTLHDSAWWLFAPCEVAYIINDLSQKSRQSVKLFRFVSPCRDSSSGGDEKKVGAGGRVARPASLVARAERKTWKRRSVEALTAGGPRDP
jgi:hypothetical protein